MTTRISTRARCSPRHLWVPVPNARWLCCWRGRCRTLGLVEDGVVVVRGDEGQQDLVARAEPVPAQLRSPGPRSGPCSSRELRTAAIPRPGGIRSGSSIGRPSEPGSDEHVVEHRAQRVDGGLVAGDGQQVGETTELGARSAGDRRSWRWRSRRARCLVAPATFEARSSRNARVVDHPIVTSSSPLNAVAIISSAQSTKRCDSSIGKPNMNVIAAGGIGRPRRPARGRPRPRRRSWPVAGVSGRGGSARTGSSPSA